MRVKLTVSKIIDLDEVQLPDSPPLRFRAEIVRGENEISYDAIVYRLETFRLTPTFGGSGESVEADHNLFIIDDFFRQFSFTSSSPEETIALLLQKMSEIFG